VVRKWIVAAAVVVGAFAVASCSSPGSPSNRSSASTSASSGQGATCEKYLSVSQAEQFTGATSFHVSAQTGFDWSDFPSRPTAQCTYNDVGGIGGSVVPDLTKSPVLWLWLKQSDASQVYSALASGWPYYRSYAQCFVPLAGLGQRATTCYGQVIVQVSSDYTFSISSGSNSSNTSMAMAKMIAQEISPEGSGGSPVVNASGRATGTPTSSVGNSGTTGNASSGNAPTPTVPPTIPPTTTTNPPTTTTTVPLTSAQQSFANAVISQLPSYVSSTSPPLTASAIANVGSEICTAFSIGSSQYVSGGGGPAQDADSFVYQAMLPELVNGAIEGGSGSVAVPPISGDGGTLINLAIQGLCPQYSDGIPSG